jgi:hypothetical protein
MKWSGRMRDSEKLRLGKAKRSDRNQPRYERQVGRRRLKMWHYTLRLFMVPRTDFLTVLNLPSNSSGRTWGYSTRQSKPEKFKKQRKNWKSQNYKNHLFRFKLSSLKISLFLIGRIPSKRNDSLRNRQNSYMFEWSSESSLLKES